MDKNDMSLVDIVGVEALLTVICASNVSQIASSHR